MMVMELMTYPITSVRPDATVQDAIDLMVAGGKGSVLVTREGLLKEVLGIVTTTRIFTMVFAPRLDPKAVKVSEIMTKAPLITVKPTASAREAAELMMRHKIRRLPVVEEGTLVGIITSKDLLYCVD